MSLHIAQEINILGHVLSLAVCGQVAAPMWMPSPAD